MSKQIQLKTVKTVEIEPESAVPVVMQLVCHGVSAQVSPSPGIFGSRLRVTPAAGGGVCGWVMHR